jgi:hypothetical protein
LVKRDKWTLRLTATAAALLLAGGIFVMQRIPSAETLRDGDEQLSGTPTQTLALMNLPPAPVLQYDGALGAGLLVNVSSARLTPETRKNLQMLGLKVPNVKGGPIRWQGWSAPHGRVAVRIRNQRRADDAGMMLQATGSGSIPELNIRAVRSTLLVQIDMVTQDPAELPRSELNFADADLNSPGLAFAPFQFEVQPGEGMNLAFENNEALANSAFRLGELLDTGGTATALNIGRAELGKMARGGGEPRLRSVIGGVCASPPGRLLVTRLYPTPADCRLGDDLYASDITVEPRKVAIGLEGSGFIIKDGAARPSSIFSSITANPVVAALLSALVLAIAGPAWRLWTGREL